MSESLSLRLPEADPRLGGITTQKALQTLSGGLIETGRLSEPRHLAGSMQLNTEVRGNDVTVQCAMSARESTPCGVTLTVRRFEVGGNGESVDRRSFRCGGAFGTSVVLNNLSAGLYLVDAQSLPYGPGYNHFSTGPGAYVSFSVN